MTEEEWLVCKDLQPMLDFLSGKEIDRKLRLFACGCCQQCWNRLTVKRCRHAVEIGEQYANDATVEPIRSRVHSLAVQAASEARPRHLRDFGFRYVGYMKTAEEARRLMAA